MKAKLTISLLVFLLPIWGWMPSDHPVIAKELAFYRQADFLGYWELISTTRRYDIIIARPDKESPWFKALPDYLQTSSMFVYDTPTIWVNNWNLQRNDPDMTISAIEHELTHVLSRWYPDVLLRREGHPGPPVDINNWRTWAEQEIYAANIQLRVAKRLRSEAGIRFAKAIARAQIEDMGPTRLAAFLAQYGGWLDPDLLPSPSAALRE